MRRFLPVAFVALLVLASRFAPPEQVAAQSNDLPCQSSPGQEPEEKDITARLQQVKAKTGPLEITLAWNNKNDLDLHVVAPSKEEVFHGNRNSRCGGHLDVDMNVNYAGASKAPVEHVVWEKKAPPGRYQVWVHHYMNHNKPDCKDPTHFIVMVKTKGEFKTFRNSISFTGMDKSKKKAVEFTIDTSCKLIVEKKKKK